MQYVGVSVAAKRLGVSRQTARTMAKRGHLRAIRYAVNDDGLVGYIVDRDSIRQAIAEREGSR